MAQRILLLEDEQAIADTLIYSLRSEGFEVAHLTLVCDALAAFAHQAPDLAILDVGLPDGNGFDVCRAIRKTSELPILFLTARSEEIDRILGLELGADDYVSKPFSPREVGARVKAILRRSATRVAAPAGAGVKAAPLLQLDEGAQRIRCAPSMPRAEGSSVSQRSIGAVPAGSITASPPRITTRSTVSKSGDM